jgi:hypothetical protein
MSSLGCYLHGWVKWVVNEGMPFDKGRVEVVLSETAEVKDGGLSGKDPMVGGRSETTRSHRLCF